MAYYIKEETLTKVRKHELNRRGVRKQLNYAIDCCNKLAKQYLLNRDNELLPERTILSVENTYNDKTLYQIIIG